MFKEVCIIYIAYILMPGSKFTKGSRTDIVHVARCAQKVQRLYF